MVPDERPLDPTDAVRRAWQEGETSSTPPTLDALRRRSARFSSRISWRNALEYMAGAAVMPLIVADVVRGGFNGLVDVGNVLVIAGMSYVLYRLHRHASARRLPTDLGAIDALSFHRSELVRQRDLLMSVWQWYLLPFAPGMITVTVGRALQSPAGWHRGLVSGIVALGLAGFLVWVNRRAGARLSRDIEALDRLAGGKQTRLDPPERPSLVELLTTWVIRAFAMALAPIFIGTAVGLIPFRPPGSAGSGLAAPTWVSWWIVTATVVCAVVQAAWWYRKAGRNPNSDHDESAGKEG